MDKKFDFRAIEQKWYGVWTERKAFHADADSAKEPYCIVIPPPNVTGILTLGHVLNNTLQDVLIRWEKMRGKEACWVPGTDHAGIATQCRVEHELWEKERLTRYDLGRDAFLERVWRWKEQYGGTIVRQLRRLGVACDWDRECFTLDPALSAAVRRVFVTLHRKGLIYKGHRIINWCPKSRTALSDEEVLYREQKGKLWHIKYPFTEGDGHIVVATTRPETMLGDTAVAVNLRDPRYAGAVGRTLDLPLTGRRIPVIADAAVDVEMGTGAVKVTPAHDPADYDIGQRHDLPVIGIMNEDGTMNAEAGAAFSGLDRYECRKKVIALLEEAGLLVKVEDWVHQVGYSERGGVPIEPRLSEQWFVRMKPLAEPALKAVMDSRVRFHPERWVKSYQHWMENVRDWCISRQIWWGHRIPAYYCRACSETVVSETAPVRCPKCGGAEFRQDEDVLDTWFSSWLWPFSVFGWPDQTRELARFYPTRSLVTGPDIIFFWVARMIMAGLEFMGEVPFKDVYFTPIIRDERGRKLSKSLGNSPDPLEVMDTYGADALRFTIVYLAPIGQDIRYSNEKCETGRNFATKLWNAARFIMMQAEDGSGPSTKSGAVAGRECVAISGLGLERMGALLCPEDKYALAKLHETIGACTRNLDAFRFNEAAHAVYEFVWHEYCDWYLEYVKHVLKTGGAERGGMTLGIARHVFANVLLLLHPFMPYLTEELWHVMEFGCDSDMMIHAAWPVQLDGAGLGRRGVDEAAVWDTSAKHELVRAGRMLRADYGIPASRKLNYAIKSNDARTSAFLKAEAGSLGAFLNAESLVIDDPSIEAGGIMPSAVTRVATVFMPIAGLVDVESERRRLSQDLAKLEAEHGRICAKLEDSEFLGKAPREVVAAQEERRRELGERGGKLRHLIEMLGDA